MPLGVEHEYPGTQLYFPFEIPKPLMPLGVEQWLESKRSAWDADIPKPLMPLGVEHAPNVAATAINAIPKPLMPLGVEHINREWIEAGWMTFLNL